MKNKYDPEIICKYADKLYSQAASIIAGRTIAGIFFGVIGGIVFQYYLPTEPRWLPVAVGTVLFGLLGYNSAQAKAFELRLRAQDALCQVQIEKNTRTQSS
ncbi:MAG: hypothetical protein IT582_06605 [Opitutaceae bacterium]|nr:hypothetical protein [Opitutaceae bacterium]